MCGFPLAALLALSVPVFAGAEGYIKGTYLDEDVPQSCGLFQGEQQRCSATIIGPKQAFTSAHCHDEKMNELLSATTGPLNVPHLFTLQCGKSREKRYVRFAVKQTDWKAGTDSANDRMLLAVTEKFTAPPMPLADDEFLKKIEDIDAKPDCKIAGWGLDNDEKSGVLRVAKLKHVHHRGDRLIYGFENNRSDKGDSGGTLMCKVGAVWKLVGVIRGSWDDMGYSVAALAQIPTATLAKPFELALKNAELRKSADKLPVLSEDELARRRSELSRRAAELAKSKKN